jgi:peptidoglycan hydrolase CwlO-like protein
MYLSFSSFKAFSIFDIQATDLMDINIFIPTLVAIASSVITWFFTRKKTKAETDQISIGNVKSVIKLWEDTAQALRKEVLELRSQVTELTDELEQHRKENGILKLQLDRLERKLSAYKGS